MDKLWAGRTAGTTANLVDEINSSIAVDRRLYKRDIAGSIAHAKMMAKQNIISQEEAEAIIQGLTGIEDDGQHALSAQTDLLHGDLCGLQTKEHGVEMKDVGLACFLLTGLFEDFPHLPVIVRMEVLGKRVMQRGEQLRYGLFFGRYLFSDVHFQQVVFAKVRKNESKAKKK